MKRYLLLIVMVSCLAFELEKEVPLPQAIIQEVFDLAKAGYDNLDPKALIKAAKILIENPEIQYVKIISQSNEYEPSEAEAILEQHNFFDPIELLGNAKKFAPFDAKILHQRIEQLEKKLPTYKEMSLNFNEIKVNNYTVFANNSKKIVLKFNKNKKISLSLHIGNGLKLSVVDATLKKNVGKSQAIGPQLLLSFMTETDGNYHIIIENTTEKPNDCYLMIETN